MIFYASNHSNLMGQSATEPSQRLAASYISRDAGILSNSNNNSIADSKIEISRYSTIVLP
jgi:hypothetical protein